MYVYFIRAVVTDGVDSKLRQRLLTDEPRASSYAVTSTSTDMRDLSSSSTGSCRKASKEPSF